MKIKIANMCNCGNKRNELNHSPTSMSGPVVAATRHQPRWPDVSFEYTGKTALSVAGNITGKKYRFHHPGDIQLIDYRDASGMMAIPVLKNKGKRMNRFTASTIPQDITGGGFCNKKLC
jgi:hypothetical protein